MCLHEDNDVDHERRDDHCDSSPQGDGFQARVERYQPGPFCGW